MASVPAELRYLETSIKTASPEELIVTVFDVLVLSSTQALEKMRSDPGDLAGIHQLLRRGQRALTLLMGSLDFEIGGALAQNLFQIYEFWHHELMLANVHKDPTRVERLLPNFREYRETWSEAVKAFRAMQRPVTPAQASLGFAAVG